MALTDMQVKALRAREKRCTVPDGRGLILEVHHLTTPGSCALFRPLPFSEVRIILYTEVMGKSTLRAAGISVKPMTGIVSPDGGAKGVWKHTALKGGTVIEHSILLDRYGHANGNFLSPAETPFDKRGLPEEQWKRGYHKYSVVKTLHVQKSDVLPCFEQPGGGQHLTEKIVKELLNAGYLKEVED